MMVSSHILVPVGDKGRMAYRYKGLKIYGYA